MSATDDVERAEHLAGRRARLLPLAGIGLIVGNALASGPPPAQWPARLAWLAVFAAGFGLVLGGGAWPGRLHRLMEDETTRAARAGALLTGYCATFACLAGLFVTSFFIVLPPAQVLEIALTTAIAAPLIGFGVRERAALLRA